MKATCVSILLVCLAAATFSNWLVIASFKINQAYIAKELCVNRNNPNSHCNGHCYLCKQLTKDEKPEGTNGTTSKEKFEVQLFFVDGLQQADCLSPSTISFNILPQPFAKQLVVKSFFHPPSVLQINLAA